MILFIVMGVLALVSMGGALWYCIKEEASDQRERSQRIDREYKSMCDNARKDGFIR